MGLNGAQNLETHKKKAEYICAPINVKPRGGGGGGGGSQATLGILSVRFVPRVGILIVRDVPEGGGIVSYLRCATNLCLSEGGELILLTKYGMLSRG